MMCLTKLLKLVYLKIVLPLGDIDVMPGSFRLLESGDHRLLEDGSYRLLES